MVGLESVFQGALAEPSGREQLPTAAAEASGRSVWGHIQGLLGGALAPFSLAVHIVLVSD